MLNITLSLAKGCHLTNVQCSGYQPLVRRGFLAVSTSLEQVRFYSHLAAHVWMGGRVDFSHKTHVRLI